MKININKNIQYAFFYLFIVTCLGIFLRLTYVLPIPFSYDYRNLLHAHSHTAFLGWIYVLLTGYVSREFISSKNEKTHQILFYLTQISILGMLFSFSMQGYGFFSILFSTFFVFLSYYFSYFFFKKSKNTFLTSESENNIAKISYQFVKMGIFYLIISSLGIWMIPISIVQFGKNSDFYKSSIAFFLHFQYNGWILSTLMGLFLQQFNWNLNNKQWLNRFFYGFQIAIIGTLPVSWIGIFNLPILHFIGGFFSILWLVTILIIIGLYFYKNAKKYLSSTFFLLFFLLKILAMIIGIIFEKKGLIFNNPDLIISYLHLNFLGIINFGLIFLLQSFGFFKPNKWLIIIYLIAFFSTEFLVAYKGFSLWFGLPFFEHYFSYLAFASALFLIPVGIWWLKAIKLKKRQF